MAQPAKVAILKTKPSTVLKDIDRLMDMAEVEKHLPKGKPVILKDNISWHMLYPGANTTPWQLEGVILGLKKRGYKEIICVENETVVTNPFKGEVLNKFKPVLEKYKIPVYFNFKPEHMKWVDYKPKAKMLVLDKIFPEGIRVPDFFIGKSIVHLPTMKCHIYTTTTGAMKNAFGGLIDRKRHYTHSWIHDTLVDLLAIQKEIHAGVFAVMDGTTAGNGPGPRTMIPVVKDYILASGDQVAIDAMAAKMMGFDPLKLRFIRNGQRAGLGIGDPKKIQVVGENVSQVNWHFHAGKNLPAQAGHLMWFGPLRGLQNLLFHTSFVNVFVWGSAFYHDYLWYPTVGKMVVDKWLKETPWGRLFEKY